MTVLIVASSMAQAELFERALGEAGYGVERCDAERVAERAASDRYDVVLLEWSLQGVDAVGVCRLLRRRGSAAHVMLLSDRTDVRDKVAALEAGADDYVVQPVDPREVVARVRALERRSGVIRRAVRAFGGIVLDEREMTVTVEGKRLDLTPRELRLLSYLLRHAGETVTRTEIIADVWANLRQVGSNIVDVYIRRLRAKLGEAGDQVKTIRGVGYRFEEFEPLRSTLDGGR
jgi:two-component system, OmpR family, response regulator